MCLAQRARSVVVAALASIAVCAALLVVAPQASALTHQWSCWTFSDQDCWDVAEYHGWVEISAQTSTNVDFLCANLHTQAGNARSRSGGGATCAGSTTYFRVLRFGGGADLSGPHRLALRAAPAMC